MMKSGDFGDLDQLFDAMGRYGAGHDDWIIDSLEDKENFRIGFRCRDTGKEWWLHVPTLNRMHKAKRLRANQS